MTVARDKPMQNSIIIRPVRNISGGLRLPGDKSVSHRYAMLGGLASGTTRLANYSTGADCASTLACVAALGATVERREAEVSITGTGGHFTAPRQPLDCGNSGSTMRMLAGLVAGHPFTAEMVGDESLSRRPMARVIEPLTRMGARFESGDGRPPLRVTGAALQAIDYKAPVASAQVKTALLFAGLLAQGETSVEEPLRTRDHGELALRAFGAEVTRSRNRAAIRGGQKLQAIEASIPGDISSAAFFLCAAALFPESNLVIDGLLLNPTRAAILDVLAAIGLRTSMVQVEEFHGELVGSVSLQPGRLRGATIRGGQTALLIDELPVLAAIAPYTQDGIEIRDARELRVKESDRIASIARNLRAMGARVEELEDGLKVPGGQRLHGAEVDSFGDHRIAMAIAVAGLRAEGDTLIRGADAARISFPGFFTALESVVER